MSAPGGTPRSFTLNGITVYPKGDMNATFEMPQEKEAIAHAGGNIIQVTAKPAVTTNCQVVAVDATDLQGVLDLDKVTVAFTISMTESDGSVWRCSGWINVEGYETQTRTINFTLIPESRDWVLFGAT